MGFFIKEEIDETKSVTIKLLKLAFIVLVFEHFFAAKVEYCLNMKQLLANKFIAPPK